MANEKRVRLNNVIGTLGTGLTNVATTIDFGATAPAFPAIDTTKHAVIIIEPDTIREEIVYLTAYTVGATTGTILRGQEGSTAQAHSATAPWVHGPTKRDTAAGRLAFVKRTSGDISVVSSPAYRDTVLADSPAGYWRLGESSGTVAADSSGNARNGTYTGGGMTLGVTGLINDSDLALQLLAAQTGYVDLGNPAAFQATTFSVECWFKTSVSTGRQMLVAKFAAWRVQILNGIIGVYAESSGDKNSTVNVADGLVHHVVVTYQSSVANGLKIYLDGTLILTATATVGAQGNNMLIGWDASNQHLQGTIDEVAFYPTLLTQAQVTAHNSSGLTGSSNPWKAVDSGGSLDLVIPATAGDVIEVGLDALVETGDAYFDVATMVAGSVVNYWGGAGAATDYGIVGWAAGSATRGVAGPAMKVVTAADISGGTVTLRLYIRPVVTLTVDATAAKPFHFWAKNHGPQEAA